jgi:hypothetical protein
MKTLMVSATLAAIGVSSAMAAPPLMQQDSGPFAYAPQPRARTLILPPAVDPSVVIGINGDVLGRDPDAIVRYNIQRDGFNRTD